MPKQRFVAIDPSIRKTGWARVTNGHITDVGYIKLKKTAYGSRPLDLANQVRSCAYGTEVGLVIEVPGWYPGREKNPRSILKLATAAGACIGAYNWQWVATYEPEEWKGVQDKKEHHKRLLTQLPKHIKVCIFEAPKTVQGDMLDACGLALHGIEDVKDHEGEGIGTYRDRFRKAVAEARRTYKAHTD